MARLLLVSMASREVQVRPLTVVLIVVAVLCVLAGVYYVVTPAKDLPAFVPGHLAHATRHHVKHGLAMFMLAAAALVGAWFTTAPKTHTSA
jgi:hypothetical protein